MVGPLATAPEPHSWDLCVNHAGRITAPRGWELVRHSGPLAAPPEDDDLVALADAVREGRVDPMSPAGGWYPQHPQPGLSNEGPDGPDSYGAHAAHRAPAGALNGAVLATAGRHAKSNGRRRGHLRVLPDPSD